MGHEASSPPPRALFVVKLRRSRAAEGWLSAAQAPHLPRPCFPPAGLQVRAFLKEPRRSQKGLPARPVVGTAVSEGRSSRAMQTWGGGALAPAPAGAGA